MSFLKNRRATTIVALISLILLVISYSLHAVKWFQAIILVIFLISAFAFTFSTGWQHYKENVKEDKTK